MTTPIDVWIEVGAQPVEVRCPNPRCRKLLHRVVSSDGATVISDKCKCGTLVEVHISHTQLPHRAAGMEIKGA